MTEALEHLNEAIEFIKGIAPDVWAVYLRQQVLEGWTNLGMMAAGLICGLVLFCVGFKLGGRYNWNDPDAFKYIPLLGLGIVVLVIALISMAADGPEAIRHILNPAYYAIKELLP